MNKVLIVGDIPAKFDRIYATKDRDTPAVTYEVNVARLSCTCGDFLDRRAQFPLGDVRRVCVHVYDKLYQTKAERAFDPVVQLFIRYGREMLTYRILEDALGSFVLGFPFGPRQCRAIAIVADKPLIATYDLAAQDWSPGETPLTAVLAAELLERMRRTYPEAFSSK